MKVSSVGRQMDRRSLYGIAIGTSSLLLVIFCGRRVHSEADIAHSGTRHGTPGQ